MQALRQALEAAVRWGYMARNPAKLAGLATLPAVGTVLAEVVDRPTLLEPAAVALGALRIAQGQLTMAEDAVMFPAHRVLDGRLVTSMSRRAVSMRSRQSWMSSKVVGSIHCASSITNSTGRCSASSNTCSRSCASAGVTTRANRWPSVSTAMWTLDPFLRLCPSYPARAPLSGVDWIVRPSRITADGLRARPSAQRKIWRRSWAMASKHPAASQRRACW